MCLIKQDSPHAVTYGGSRQRQHTEQLKTIVTPIGLRLILGKLVLHRYSQIQNQIVREFAGVAGNHNEVNGELHSETDGGSRQRQQTEQQVSVVAPICLRLTLGKLVLFAHSESYGP